MVRNRGSRFRQSLRVKATNKSRAAYVQEHYMKRILHSCGGTSTFILVLHYHTISARYDSLADEAERVGSQRSRQWEAYRRIK
jgi:hypothetical protein